MLKEVRKMLQERAILYSPAVISEIAEKLRSLTTKTKDEKQQHIDTIKEQQNSIICPFCGGALTKRNGKFGTFIGCSSYPRCKYTRQI